MGCLDLSSAAQQGSLGQTTGRVGRRKQLQGLLRPELQLPTPQPADRFLPGEADHTAVRAYLTGRTAQYRDRRATELEHSTDLFERYSSHRRIGRIYVPPDQREEAGRAIEDIA